jgi:hypothetical protein
MTNMNLCESQEESSECQALLDIWVLCDIHIVIKINKFIILYLPKCPKCNQSEKDTEEKFWNTRLVK